jgi:hypothetical protein
MSRLSCMLRGERLSQLVVLWVNGTDDDWSHETSPVRWCKLGITIVSKVPR